VALRALLWLLALFAVAVAFTLAAGLDVGYVIVVYPPWRMELSFMLAVVLLAGIYLLVYVLLHLAQTALSLPTDLRSWRGQRRREKADQALVEAMQAYLDEDLERTRKLAAKAHDSRAPELARRLAEQAVPQAQAGVD
jgi:HemY protein